jgi:hypothetical protein
LPATLATHDFHDCGRISYILTARVEGIAVSGSGGLGLFNAKHSSGSGLCSNIEYRAEFERVIARSDKLARDLAQGKKSLNSSPLLGPAYSERPRGQCMDEHEEESAIAVEGGSSSPTLRGLFHRRRDSDTYSNNGGPIPPLSLSPPPRPGQMQRSASGDKRSLFSFMSGGSGKGSGSVNGGAMKSEKEGWMMGDLCASRVLVVHAIPDSSSDGSVKLDVRKEGWVAGLNSWRFSAVSDAVSRRLFSNLPWPTNLTAHGPTRSSHQFLGESILTSSSPSLAS